VAIDERMAGGQAMMGGAVLALLTPVRCAVCLAPLGPGDGLRLCATCGESTERALRRADPKFAAETRRHYGIAADGE